MTRTYRTIDQLDSVGKSKLYNNFSGGLNTSTTNDILRDEEATIRKNWGQDELFALKKVGGYTKKNSSAMASAKIQGLFRVYKSSGSDEFLAVCNGAMYYSDNEGTSWTGATAGTGLSATDFFTGVNYNDLFFFTSATDNLKHYTPSTNTVAAATDQPTNACKVLVKRADRRMVACVNSTASSTLYYSKVAATGSDADDWSATNDAGSIAIDGAKSDPLTGIASLGTYDLVYKDTTVFKVWDYPQTKAVRIIGSPGSAAPYSIAQGDGMVFSLARDSVDMWDGVAFEKVSEPVKAIVRAVDPAYIQNAFGICRYGFYWLFYTPTGGTTNTKCIVYDIRNSNPYDRKFIWFERDDLAMNCPVVFGGVGDDNEIYAGDSAATGFVYQLDSGTSDNTGNITAVYQTKYDNMDMPNVIKRFSKIIIQYYNTSGTFTVNYYWNKGASTASYTITGTDGEGVDIQRLPDNVVGKDISIKITHVGASTAPVIKNIQIDWEALYEK